jgi:chromosome segregation ATPase
MIELALANLPSAEVIVAGMVGFGYTLYMGWKKLKDIKDQKASGKKPAPEPSDVLGMIARERELAVSQRDQALALSEELKEANRTLREQMREFEREVDDLKAKLSLLSELNRRLSASLDVAQSEISRISQTLSKIPSIHQEP